MSDGSRPRLVRKKRLRNYCGRGELYAWLRTHHVQVATLREGEDRAWAELIVDMIEDGVRGQDRALPTINSVSKVWQRVSRDVEADAKAAAPPKRKFPSRISPDWRPQVVPGSGSGGGRQPTAPMPYRGDHGNPSSLATAPGVVDLPTTDPSGAPLPEGYVFYRGKPMLRRVGEELLKADRQADKIDRFK